MFDSILKNHTWTAHVALLFAAAWICARTVNTVAGAFIRPIPAVDLSASSAPPQRPPPPPQLQAERLYTLIGQKPPPPPQTPEELARPPKVENCHDRQVTPAKSSINAVLVASVLSDDPRASLASITDPNTRETHVYGVGDRLQNADILSIERLRDGRDATGSGFKIAVILCNNGQKEYLDFSSGDNASAKPPNPGGGPPSAPAPAPDTVTKLTDSRYEVKKKFLDDALSNMSNVATQARVVPSFKNGVANGFKVFAIQPNSLYAAIGVENGDVIQRINGYEMSSPDKALEIYQKLRDTSHITIEMERNGQTIRKEYNVVGQ